MDTSLKQEMLARGMSAEEIERVLSGGSALVGTSQVVDRSSAESNLGSRN